MVTREESSPRGWQGRLRAFGRCRICRRVTAVTFLAILVVEAIILVPSARNYERDRLAALDSVGATAAVGIVMGGASPTAMNDWLAVTPLVGLRVISPDGSAVMAGEAMSGARPTGWLSGRIDDGRRYESAWTVPHDGRAWTVEGRMDAVPVGSALTAFLVRIGVLVQIIALVVTAATMVVLERLVLRRVIAVGHAMRVTAADPGQADGARLPVRRGDNDEIGDMTVAFNHMAGAIAAHAEDARVARRAAESADAAKSDFLASMSHELRTPLNAVIGFSQILETQAFGPLGHDKYLGYARDIRGSGKHLLTLINDILDLSKAEAGRLHLRSAAMDLADVCDAALRMIAPRAEERGVILAMDVPPLALVADEQRLRQVLLNLLSNAAKFSPVGATIRLEARRLEDGGVAVLVIDAGPGMTADQITTAFEPFAQVANQPDAQAAAGTGLGLPIARRMVEAHGGTLTCESAPGQGTTMIVSLPASVVAGSAAPLVSTDRDG